MHECAGSVITQSLKRWTTFAIGLLLGWGSRVKAHNWFNTEASVSTGIGGNWMDTKRGERINEKYENARYKEKWMRGYTL